MAGNRLLHEGSGLRRGYQALPISQHHWTIIECHGRRDGTGARSSLCTCTGRPPVGFPFPATVDATSCRNQRGGRLHSDRVEPTERADVGSARRTLAHETSPSPDHLPPGPANQTQVSTAGLVPRTKAPGPSQLWPRGSHRCWTIRSAAPPTEPQIGPFGRAEYGTIDAWHQAPVGRMDVRIQTPGGFPLFSGSMAADGPALHSLPPGPV